MHRTRLTPQFQVLMFATSALLGCGTSVTRLDEAPLFERPGFRLKIVRYMERIPLSFEGPIAIVQCQSGATHARPGGVTNDAGWVIVDRLTVLDSRHATDVLADARNRLLLAGDRVVVWNHGVVVSASLDGCATFARWDARRLPDTWTLPAQRPSYCMPKGAVDCSGHDFRFIGERTPVFSNTTVGAAGTMSFTVRSAAFPKGKALLVRSGESARGWHEEIVDVADARSNATTKVRR